jgi:hypothetical protein
MKRWRTIPLVTALLCFVQLNAQQTIEAESYTESLYVGANDSEFFSGGKAISMRAAYGSYVKYVVNVSQEGTYNMEIDYSTMNWRRMYIKVEDYMPVIAEFSDFTGSWDGAPGEDENGGLLEGIKKLTVSVYLNQGDNTVEIGAFDSMEETDSPNFDKFSLTRAENQLPKPGNQPEIMILEAENATRSIGAEIKDAACYSNGKGAFSMNAANDARLIFDNVNVSEEGVYDITTYYTSMEGRNLYAKSNNYEKAVLKCTTALPYWTCPESEEHNSTSRPAILKKTTQIYMKNGNNTLIVGAYKGWSPNVDKVEIVKSSYMMEEPGYETVAAIFDYTDNVDNFLQDYTEEHTTDSVNLAKLIDNNEFTYYTVPGVSSAKVTVRLAYPIILTGYAMACPVTEPITLLDDWVIEYSQDGTSWSEVATALTVDAGSYRKVTTGYSYNEESVISAQYFRLTATGTGKVEVGDWQLFGAPYISEGQHFPEDDLTKDIEFESILSYTMASDDGFNRGGQWNEVFENVFDKKLNTVYTVVAKKTFYIQFETADPVELRSYALTVRYNESARNPSKWKLEGVDATSAEWVVLDSRENMQFPVNGSTLMFNIAEPTVCYAYKLTVEDNSGASDVHLSQWQMFADWFGINQVGTGVKEPVQDNLPVNIFSGQGKIMLQSTAGEALPYTLYSITGQHLRSGICNPGLTEISVGSGFYIVKIENYVNKVFVK